MSNTELKRTPLYQSHISLGAKMVPFAGWEMPVQYRDGLIAEHKAVRQQAGLFDVSHMGELLVEGPEAESALDYLTCNAVRTLSDFQAQYSAITNPQGGVVDDIIIYRYNSRRYLVCVNASNTDKDFAWLSEHNKFDAEIRNVSSRWGQIAFQGPAAIELAAALDPASRIGALSYFWFCETEVFGVPVIAARTGYTGEDGLEFFVPWEATEQVWTRLLEAGASRGVVPAGLGARDSLRLEACYPLHGHELADDISAIESGLGWAVKPEKGDFIGRGVLAEQKLNGSPRGLIGFFVDEPGIARQGDAVLSVIGSTIGWVTSGTKTPTLNVALGLALVERKYAKLDTPIQLEVRGRKLKAHVVKRPFYSAIKKTN